MHKKGRGVVLAGRVRECCGGSQQLGCVEFPKKKTAKKEKNDGPSRDRTYAGRPYGTVLCKAPVISQAVEDFRRPMYSSTAA